MQCIKCFNRANENRKLLNISSGRKKVYAETAKTTWDVEKTMSHVEKIISDIENSTSDIIFTFAISCKPVSCGFFAILAQSAVVQAVALNK